MLIMLDKRQKVLLPTAQVQQEVFRSMKVEMTSKTPYTDATQVSASHFEHILSLLRRGSTRFDQLIIKTTKVLALLLLSYYSRQLGFRK